MTHPTHINCEQAYFFDFLFLLKSCIWLMSRGHIYEKICFSARSSKLISILTKKLGQIKSVGERKIIYKKKTKNNRLFIF